jgi:hypothetical protein
MPKSISRRDQRVFVTRFLSVVNWLGMGLIVASLLWIVVMICGQALERLCK